MSIRVMIVDDSKIVYTQLIKMLKDTEFEVVCYSQSGESAIEDYEKCQPDVVTMDIVMPGIDGLEASKTILEKHPNAKILIASSLAYDDTVEQSKKIGAKGFIYKPFEKDELLRELRKVME